MSLRMELSQSRWKRWRDYIASGKSELVIDEFERYTKMREPCFGDLKIRDEALRQLGVLKMPRGENLRRFRGSDSD